MAILATFCGNDIFASWECEEGSDRYWTYQQVGAVGVLRQQGRLPVREVEELLVSAPPCVLVDGLGPLAPPYDQGNIPVYR